MGISKGAVPLWIFLHDTDKVEGGLMVLFSAFVVFSVAFPLEIFMPTPLLLSWLISQVRVYA